ncbi:MAG: hypothetical protein J0H79_11400 [Alphaproteobacteria bacterium]|nr:hypothetical protein [Alphaproteobacteria bacterium]
MNETNTANAPRVLPGALGQQALEDRELIQRNLEAVNARAMALADLRKAKLDAIAALQREIVECDAAIAACGVEREDLIAMDDALAEQYRALERILIRRAGR